MPLVYEENFTVLNHECDAFGRMTCGAALRRVQEIAIEQCNRLGLDDAMYKRTHTVFLLNRVSLQIRAMPGIGQPVRIQTRAYGMQRAVFHRVTSLYNGAGEELCTADTRWVLVDTESRRILRRPPEGFLMPFDSSEEPAEQQDVKLPRGLVPGEAQPRLAAYTLCDTNGHINNTRYADIVCDLLPLESLQNAPPSRMLLVYHNEIPLGNAFEVSINQQERGWYVLAGGQGQKNFEAFVTF